MKRKGFTLAEILITLGIVGVVAALTAPALVKNTAGAKVGPTLAKVVNTIEVANEELMLDKNISDLGKVYGRDIGAYFSDLSKYIRKASYNPSKVISLYKYNASHNPTNFLTNVTGEFLLPEGVSVYCYYQGESKNTNSSLKGRWLSCDIDINGSQTGKFMMGDDVFQFDLDRSGVLIPYGSLVLCNTFHGNMTQHWSGNGQDGACNSTKVGTGQGCAGSIFENNLKIIYQ